MKLCERFFTPFDVREGSKRFERGTALIRIDLPRKDHGESKKVTRRALPTEVGKRHDGNMRICGGRPFLVMSR